MSDEVTDIVTFQPPLHDNLVEAIKAGNDDIVREILAYGRAQGVNSLKLRFLPFPSCISELSSLRTLNVSQCRLLELPEEIGSLTHLRTFNANRNQLLTLPQSFVQLINLKDLLLEYNRITSLPNMTSMINLKRVMLDFNNLQVLPDWFGQMTWLKTLRIHQNHLLSQPLQSILIQGTHDILKYQRSMHACKRTIYAFFACHARHRKSSTVNVQPDQVLSSLPNWLANEIAEYMIFNGLEEALEGMKPKQEKQEQEQEEQEQENVQ